MVMMHFYKSEDNSSTFSFDDRDTLTTDDMTILKSFQEISEEEFNSINESIREKFYK